MVYTQAIGFSRVRDESTWWSVAIVIAIHVLLVLWLVSLRWSVPLPKSLVEMVLVELRATPEPAVGQQTHGAIAPAVTPNPAAAHARDKAPAAPRREVTRRDLEEAVITTEGAAEPGSALVPLAPSNPIDGQALSGLGETDGSGAAPAGGGGAQARGRFHPPEVTRRFRPDYPLDAFQARVQGSVDVMVTIGTDATVEEAHVYQSSGNESLDRAAVEAVRRYLFRPARRDNRIVEAQAVVTIDWEILGAGASASESRPR
ncbi:MAG TPA: energy transducer TonB [Rhodanobacteraceae bacterium]|nr:energy transducer TonB [Rhodanobacteraceae bacterium]